MRLGTSTNEYGTPVSTHRCDACGSEFTLCPARSEGEDDTCGFPGNATVPACASYDSERDVDLLFAAGGGSLVVEPSPLGDGALVLGLKPEDVS